MSRFTYKIHFFLLLFLNLFCMELSISAQQGFFLGGRIGYGYFRSHPFSAGDVWRSNQLILALDLNGYLLDPRIVDFSLGANYGATGYNEEWAGTDFKNFGYRIRTNFFSTKKVNFGFGYGKNVLNFGQFTPESNINDSRTTNKHFHLNLLRIKFLPNIRLNYSDQKFDSETENQSNDAEKRIDLNATKASGISHFDLNYRFFNRHNSYYDIKNFQHNMRVTERIDFDSDTKLHLNGIYSNYSVGLPDDTLKKSESGSLAVSFSKTFSEKMSSHVRYHYNLNGGSSFNAFSHNIGIRTNHHFSKDVTLTPEINYFFNRISSNDITEDISEPGAGIRINFQKDFSKFGINSSAGIYYRRSSSNLKDEISDLSQSYSVSLNAGKIEKILGSISYFFDRLDKDVSLSGLTDSTFLDGLGRKQNNHYLRLELRSNALQIMNVHFYSQYNTYRRELVMDELIDAQTFTNGIRLILKRLSLGANYAVNRRINGGQSADFNSYSIILNARLFKGVEFRVQNVKRTRTDITFLGDFERFQEAYLRYNVGKFSISALYRHRNASIQEIIRDDEGISIRISRSFGGAL